MEFMNTLAQSYKGAFRARPSHLRADAPRWLRSLTTGAVVTYAFTWVPLCVAQSEKNIADLQFMGADATQSTWMTLANIAGDFRLEAAQQQLVVDQFNLAGGAFHVSVSPVVSSGNGGTHRLFETSGNKDVLVDTQNQKGGVNVPSGSPDTGLVTAPPPPPSGGGGGSNGGSGSGTGGGGGSPGSGGGGGGSSGGTGSGTGGGSNSGGAVPVAGREKTLALGAGPMEAEAPN
jgi:hypothetical protein